MLGNTLQRKKYVLYVKLDFPHSKFQASSFDNQSLNYRSRASCRRFESGLQFEMLNLRAGSSLWLKSERQ